MPRSAQALCASLILHKLSPQSILRIIASSPREAEQLSWDLKSFIEDIFIFCETGILEDGELSDSYSQRLRYELERLLTLKPRVIITTRESIELELPDPKQLLKSRCVFEVGQQHSPETLISQLEESGYTAEGLVVERGQYCRRGGIIDVFPLSAEWPVRIEWFGDEIDSIREFDPVEQISIKVVERVVLSLEINLDDQSSTLDDYLAGVPVDCYLYAAAECNEPHSDFEITGHTFLSDAGYDQILLENKRQLVLSELETWGDTGHSIVLVSQNEGEEKRLRDWLNIPECSNIYGQLSWMYASWPKGFVWPEVGLVVLTDAEIFGRYQSINRRYHQTRDRLEKWRRASAKQQYRDFQDGDHVVHVEYGVGIYLGIKELPDLSRGSSRSVMEIEFSEAARLFVPLDQAYMVSRYVGVGKKMPSLDVLGNTRWERKKQQAGTAVMDYAAKVLELQAERELESGFAFPPDTEWQREFEEAFPYEETADQLKAIQETKTDMESSRPMDRLICGDVGFGKTEVAIRAAFKAVMSGKQVAFLVPTTVLAQQHYDNFIERMADYPVRVALLCRLVSPADQRRVMRQLVAGEVDIVIGTHRLLSQEILFKDLGLVMVDEEQRFGVEHKDKLKEKYRQIDLLTLSATPIPRTLYMALMGTRDMSTIDTPPRNRIPVETSIHAYDERLIRSAVQREMARGGQIYFLHNRVKSIQRVAKQIRFLVPDARVEVGHGQMDEHDLEEVMHRFVAGDADVLVATTIIESGLDIPNANTIVIDRADRLGLADLYQLRGRVGRSDTRAYALLMLPRDLIQGDAGKRVETIKQYTQLGAGFKVAMRDLEIRGAGNLLGTAQSGHIAAIGFELYCRLLKQAISQLKGEKVAQVKDVGMKLDFIALGQQADVESACAFIPPEYINDETLRIQAYRHLAELQDVDSLKDLRTRWKDCYGRWPESVELLLLYNRVRVAALAGNITQIDVKGEKLMLLRHGDYVVVNGRFPRLLKRKPKAKLLEIEKWINEFSS
ncbi:MAG: transcription-repair coupling factor [Verrucomicrobiota bacterium]